MGNIHIGKSTWSMKRLIVIGLILGSRVLLAGEFNPFEGPKPIAVLIQTDPWAMVMGADTPRIAVYEDSTIVFLKRTKSSASYHYNKLSDIELSDFKKHLNPVLQRKDTKRFYNLRPNVTDQAQSMFYVRDGEREFVTRVYGLYVSGTKPPSYSTREKNMVPEELFELHRYLSSVEYSDSTEWIPKYLEVMIWPYDYAPERSIIWPKEWPGLDSERSKKRGDSYSIFLDGKMLPELQKFLRTKKERGAVEIGGKKWAISYRGIFPGEPIWMKAFDGAEKK
jgi:hypothetical protein